MKSYQKILIQECGEPLVPIPLEKFAVTTPHPYEKLGADYTGLSPYVLRQSVVEALEIAQLLLEKLQPGWQLQIYDAYRPLGVQQFMVDYTFDFLLKKGNFSPNKVSPQQRQKIWEQVYQMWAPPSTDIRTPPPHSTGAAVDLRIVSIKDELLIDMGGEIDELSERSRPNFYIKSEKLDEQQYHRHRQLLDQVMSHAGFLRHPTEWWHFSLGDQMWAWLTNQKYPQEAKQAKYGRV